MDAPSIETVNCERCPRKAPCPYCGEMAKRVKHLHRVVTSIAFHKVRKIHIHYGEYKAQCGCCETGLAHTKPWRPKGFPAFVSRSIQNFYGWLQLIFCFYAA
jgi:hypothetical protein